MTTTYDPWKLENMKEWGAPLNDAMEHARAVLASHGLRLDVAVNIVAVGVDEPGELPRQSISPSGKFCKCGGPLVQTGTCETCQWCGDATGGCG